ncbi:unnamed protein product [Rotaria sordida]|uniref:Glycolipid transfer protein domain-containing protein n=1 Tax=Rotaria sordida TaxID=392033 RepID=A0A819KNA1_9BILA|nr:unnamed protein product [Rotaria sordida]
MAEHRSKGVAEANYRTSGDSSHGFDVHAVYDRFVVSLREPDNPKSPIGTQDYIDGYRELLKFCDALGYIFKFVSDDVVDKLGILQSFVDKDKKSTPHFDTIQQAIQYETEHNLIKPNPRNFTRTLLRLHRASLFLIEFLRGLADQPLSETTATIATRSYDATLSPYLHKSTLDQIYFGKYYRLHKTRLYSFSTFISEKLACEYPSG